MERRAFNVTAVAAAAIWVLIAVLIGLPGERLKPLLTVAPAFTALVAVIALLIASWQLSLNRKSQRETIAKTNFREFLKLCVEYPEFAFGNPGQEQQKYEWFVAHFLWAAEEILEFAPDEWEANLRLHIRYHRNFLGDPAGSFRREDRSTYTRKLQNFVDEALQR